MSTRYHFPEGAPTVTRKNADVYHFTWPGDSFGWAIFTVCDETGEFSIQSDWGNFSHRWNPRHLGEGKTLTEFLAVRPDHHYVTNKLSYGSKGLAMVFDRAATWRAFRKTIIAGVVYAESREKAREMWPLAKEFCEACDRDGVDATYHNSDFNDLFAYMPDAYELLATTRPLLWTIVERELLPRFAEYVRENVLPGRRARQVEVSHGAAS